MRGINAGSTEYEVETDHFSQYDALPPRLRSILANAPYPFAVNEIAVFYRKLLGSGFSRTDAETLIYDRFVAMVDRTMQKEIIANYGPDHPQANPNVQK